MKNYNLENHKIKAKFSAGAFEFSGNTLDSLYLTLGMFASEAAAIRGKWNAAESFTRVARCTRNECGARGGPGATEESRNAKANVPNVYNLGSSTSALRSGQASRTLNPSTYYCLPWYLLNTGIYSLPHPPRIDIKLFHCFILPSFFHFMLDFALLPFSLSFCSFERIGTRQGKYFLILWLLHCYTFV